VTIVSEPEDECVLVQLPHGRIKVSQQRLLNALDLDVANPIRSLVEDGVEDGLDLRGFIMGQHFDEAVVELVLRRAAGWQMPSKRHPILIPCSLLLDAVAAADFLGISSMADAFAAEIRTVRGKTELLSNSRVLRSQKVRGALASIDGLTHCLLAKAIRKRCRCSITALLDFCASDIRVHEFHSLVQIAVNRGSWFACSHVPRAIPLELQDLDISAGLLDDIKASALALALQQIKGLLTLNICNAQAVTMSGWTSLADALAMQSALQTLHIRRSCVVGEELVVLAVVLSKLKHFEKLDLDDPSNVVTPSAGLSASTLLGNRRLVVNGQNV